MSNPKIELHIQDHGVITLELDADKAPKTVANFLNYVEQGHYDDTIFHRVIPGFMVQGGGMSPGMKEKKVGTKLENEADNGLTNDCYTVAMARTSDPHSATSQFFINVKDNDFLNHSPGNYGYAVFGRVTNGMDVIDAISEVPTTRRRGHSDVPTDDVVILTVTRETTA